MMTERYRTFFDGRTSAAHDWFQSEATFAVRERFDESPRIAPRFLGDGFSEFIFEFVLLLRHGGPSLARLRPLDRPSKSFQRLPSERGRELLQAQLIRRAMRETG